MERRIAQDLAPIAARQRHSFDRGAWRRARFALHLPPALPDALHEGKYSGPLDACPLPVTHMLTSGGKALFRLTKERLCRDGQALRQPARISDHHLDVRTSEDPQESAIFADAMIFEGFRPSPMKWPRDR